MIPFHKMPLCIQNMKTELYLGKIFGFVFFSTNLQKNETLFDFCYCLPMLVFYLYYGLKSILINNDYSKEKYITLSFSTLTCCTICIASVILRPIYFVLNRRSFKTFLVALKEFSLQLKEDTDVNHNRQLNIHLLLIILCIVFNVVWNMTLIHSFDFGFYLTYAFPMECALIEQYIIFTINKELHVHINVINKYFFNSLKYTEQISERQFVQKCQQYKIFVELSRNANKVFGFSILTSLCSGFVTFITSGNYSFLAFTRPNLDRANMIWMITISCRLYFTIRVWGDLENEVSI